MRNPLRHHNKNHRYQGQGAPFETCRVCARDEAVCKRKIRFATWQEANEWVTEYNESTGYTRPVTRYPCRWCNGWHMKTAKDPRTRARVERARRKWLVAQAQRGTVNTPTSSPATAPSGGTT